LTKAPRYQKKILESFAAKFMNFLRNRYYGTKILNTIGGILRFDPTDPELPDRYFRKSIGFLLICDLFSIVFLLYLSRTEVRERLHAAGCRP
jgi:hypothetical protein